MMLNNLNHAGGGNWIAGYWLKKRWGVAEFEIVDAMREGHLHPKDEEGRFLLPDMALKIWVGEANVGRQLTTLRYVDLALFSMAEIRDYERANRLNPAILTSTTTEPGQDQESKPTTIKTIPGTAWDQIRIRIAKNDRIEITRPGFRMEFYNTRELGLEKARTKLALLKTFGLSGGELKKDITKDASAANISNLRKQISSIFPDVEGDPIPMNKEGKYACQFQIATNKDEFSSDHYTRDEASEEIDWQDIMGARS